MNHIEAKQLNRGEDMTQQEWDKMSTEEKQDFLLGHKARVDVQTALNGKAKVGSDDAFVTIYNVYRGEVQTGQAYTLLDAANMDAEACGLEV